VTSKLLPSQASDLDLPGRISDQNP